MSKKLSVYLTTKLREKGTEQTVTYNITKSRREGMISDLDMIL